MTFSGMSKGRGILFRALSLFLIHTFLLSNIAFAVPTQEPPTLPSSKETVTNPEKIVIPREAGLVRSKFNGNADKIVIHIQDAHCNFEAQSNIVKILENLIKNYNLSFVSVEGADGVIDTSWFKAFPDDEVRREVATYFMKKGEITGPEFLSITSDYPIKLFGAETRSYYIQNLNAFTSSYPLKEETEKYFNQVKTILNRLKNYIYNEDLKLLDARMQDYEAKKIQFNDYVRFLQGMAEREKVNVRQYDNFFRLISVLVYEKKIDFNVTDKERSALIDELSKRLTKDGLTELVNQSLSFKVGKISSSEYYAYLKNLALTNGIEISKQCPNLANYIIYNSVYAKIENEKLFHEIKEIEVAVKEKLFQNDDQRTLERLSRHVETLLGMVNIKLLNGDFEYYKNHKEEFSHEVFSDFIKQKTIQYGLAYNVEAPNPQIAENVSKLEEFYTVAIKRDKALVDNTLSAMTKDNLKIAVLVTGGFHSEGIAKILEKQGVSYMVVCPNITKDAPSPYIQILTNQRTPLEEILVGTAEAKEGAKQGLLAAPLVTPLTHLTDRQFRDYFKGLVDAEGLQVRVETVESMWITLYVNGRHVETLTGGGEEVRGYIEHARSGVGGVSSSVQGIVDKFVEQLRAGCDKYGIPAAERDAIIGKVRAQLPEPVQDQLKLAMETQLKRKGVTPGTNAIRVVPAAQADRYEQIDERIHDEYNRILKQSFDEGTYEIRRFQINGRGADICIHYGLEDRIFARNKEIAAHNQNAPPDRQLPYLPTDLEVHPGRGGPQYRHQLTQIHLSGLKFFFFNESQIAAIVNHEVAHIDIANGMQKLIDEHIIERPNDIMSMPEAGVTAVGALVPATCLNYIKAFRAQPGLDEEDFVDSLPGCDTRTSGIRDKFRTLENTRARSAETLARLERNEDITLEDLDTVTQIDRQFELGSRRVHDVFTQIRDKSKYRRIREYIDDYLAHRSMLDYITQSREIASSPNKGFDIYIFVSTSRTEAEYWQERFEATRGQVLPKNAIILSVYSEGANRWHGKTDNGSASLYSFQLANQLLQEQKYSDMVKAKYGRDMTLMEILAQERPVMMMLMAGKGKRMQPMGANNKSSIALLDTVVVNGERVPITVGESVARTFGPLATSRGGRLTEVWGDQINLPGEDITSDRRYAIEIFNTVCPFETAADKAYAVQKGVLIATGEERDVLQREKPPVQEIEASARKVSGIEVADLSLGFNSYRWELLAALLEMYKTELADQIGYFNIDSDLWAPLTFETGEAYAGFMWEKRRVDFRKSLQGGKIDQGRFNQLTSPAERARFVEENQAWWMRIRAMLDQFRRQYGDRYRIFNGRQGVIGRVDFGFKDKTTDWWDFGQIRNYYESLMAALLDSTSVDKRRETWAAERVRRYFGIHNKDEWVRRSKLGEVKVENSIVQGCNIARGNIKNSILINVTAEEINVENAIVIGSTVYKLTATEGFNVVQNVMSSAPMRLDKGDVLVSHAIPGQGQKVFKLNWLIKDINNPNSYEPDEIYDRVIFNNPMTFAALSDTLKNYTKAQQEEEREKVLKVVKREIEERAKQRAVAAILYAIRSGERQSIKAHLDGPHGDQWIARGPAIVSDVASRIMARFNDRAPNAFARTEMVSFCNLLIQFADRHNNDGLKRIAEEERRALLENRLSQGATIEPDSDITVARDVPASALTAEQRILNTITMLQRGDIPGISVQLYSHIYGIPVPEATEEMALMNQKIERYEYCVQNFKPVKMGTSGLRGDADSVLTDMEVYINFRAQVEYLLAVAGIPNPTNDFVLDIIKRGGISRGDTVALAGDRRPSTVRVARAIAMAILESGCKVDFQGLTTTPSISNFGLNSPRALASIMVTASHNPPSENGAKTYRPNGEILKPEEPILSKFIEKVRRQEYLKTWDESMFDQRGMLKAMTALAQEGQKQLLMAANRVVLQQPEGSAVLSNVKDVKGVDLSAVTGMPGYKVAHTDEAYLKRFVDVYGKPFIGKDIIVYQQSAVGRDIIPATLRALGANVITVEPSEEFVPIDTENLSEEAKTKLRGFSQKYRAGEYDPSHKGRKPFAVISFDGDSDRPVFCDENGEFLYGDKLGILASIFLKVNYLAIPITANTKALALARERFGAKVTSTKVGSPYVIEEGLREEGREIAANQPRKRKSGFEVNGGYLLLSDVKMPRGTLKALPTRDSLLPMLCVMLLAMQENKPVSGLIADMFSGAYESYGQAGLVERIEGGNVTPGCESYRKEMGPAIVAKYTPASPAKARIAEVIFENGKVYYTLEGAPEERIEAASQLTFQMKGIAEALKGYLWQIRGLNGIEIQRINYLDGVRIYFANGEIVHLRPSGNAAQFRIYSEAATQDRAGQIVKQAVGTEQNIGAKPTVGILVQLIQDFAKGAPAPALVTPGVHAIRTGSVAQGEEEPGDDAIQAIVAATVSEVPELIPEELTPDTMNAAALQAARGALTDYVRAKYAQTIGTPVNEMLLATIVTMVVERAYEKRMASRMELQRVTVEALRQGGVEQTTGLIGVDRTSGALTFEGANNLGYNDRKSHDFGYVVGRLFRGMVDLGARWTYSIAYSMTHFDNGSLHAATTFGASPLIPTSPIYQVTGSHSQGLVLDIKLMKVPGIQQIPVINEKGKVVSYRYMVLKPGDWAFSIPGSIDIFIAQTGGVQFADRSISYRLDTAQGKKVAQEVASLLGISVETLTNSKLAEGLPSKGMPYIFYRDEKGAACVTVNPSYKGKVPETAPVSVKPYIPAWNGQAIDTDLLFNPRRAAEYNTSGLKSYLESEEFVMDVVRKITDNANLDVDPMIWVEDYMRNYPGAVFFVARIVAQPSVQFRTEAEFNATSDKAHKAFEALDAIISGKKPLQQTVFFKTGKDGYTWGVPIPINGILDLMGAKDEAARIALASQYGIPATEVIGERWICAGAIDVGVGYPLPLEVLALWPEETFGAKHMEEIGASFGITAKHLTAGRELSIQSHDFDEMIVVQGKPGPDVGMYVGFKENLTPERMLNALLTGEIEKIMNWVPLAAGDVYFVPAGMVHAYGKVNVFEVKAVTPAGDSVGTRSFYDRLKLNPQVKAELQRYLSTIPGLPLEQIQQKAMEWLNSETGGRQYGYVVGDVRNNKDALTMPGSKIGDNIRSVEKAGYLRAINPESLRVKPVVLAQNGPSILELLSVYNPFATRNGFALERFTLMPEANLSADLLTAGVPHTLFVQEGTVELVYKDKEGRPTSVVETLPAGTEKSVLANADQYDVRAVGAKAVVYAQYKPLQGERAVNAAFQAVSNERARITAEGRAREPEKNKFTIWLPKKLHKTKEDFDRENIFIRSVTDGLVNLEQYTNIEVLRVNTDRDVVVAMKGDLEQADRAKIQDILKSIRMLTIPQRTRDKAGERITFYAREIESTAIVLGNTSLQELADPTSYRTQDLYNLITQMTDRPVDINDLKSLVLAVDGNIDERLRKLTEVLLLTMPIERFEIDKGIESRRQVLWSV